VCVIDGEGATTSYSYSDIVSNIAITYKSKVDKRTTEIKVPCIVKRAYRLQYTINRTALENILPKEIDPNKIQIEFYQGASADSADSLLNVSMTPKDPEITNKRIKGKCRFRILDAFALTKTKNLLFVALRIETIQIKYLVVDIAVFTNVSQITDDYKLVISKAKKLLNPCFWYRDATFLTKAEAATQKEEREIAPIPPEKQALAAMIQATEKSLQEMKKLYEEESSDNEDNVSSIMQELNSVYNQHFTKPVVAVPETPPLVTSDPDETPLFELNIGLISPLYPSLLNIDEAPFL
jgi:hypothetical protein